MKKFFTVVPMQQKGDLTGYVYQARGNADLQMENATRFPILTSVNAYAVPGEDFRLIAVMPDLENERYNCGLLREELQKLCDAKGLTCSKGVEVVIISADEKVSSHVATFQTLLDYVDDEDELHICMTYGTKPLSTAVIMAAQYAYRVKKNASLSCVLYGKIVRPERDKATWYGEVYDMTALIQLDEIVRVLANRGVENPKETIDRILEL